MARCKVIHASAEPRIDAWTWQRRDPLEKPQSHHESDEQIEISALEPPCDDPTDLDTLHGPPQTSVEELVRKSYDDGYQTGHSAAAQDLRARFSDLAKAIKSLDELSDRLHREAEKDQVAIAIAVARRILHREVHADPNALRGLVSTAMEKVQSHKLIRIVIDPVLKDGLLRALSDIPGGESIAVNADKAMAPGTILFETTRGTLDASFETQLAEVHNGLVDQLNRV